MKLVAAADSQSRPQRDGMVISIQSAIGSSSRQAGDLGFHLDVELALPGSGVTAVFGASGSGKTSLLRCVAGLQTIDRGTVRINGETWHDENTTVATHHRGIGYVFQEASLFEHLSANGNLQYAIKRAPQAPEPDAFQQFIELMGIGPLLD